MGSDQQIVPTGPVDWQPRAANWPEAVTRLIYIAILPKRDSKLVNGKTFAKGEKSLLYVKM